MNNLEKNKQLHEFLASKGISLSSYGSAEFGLTRSDATRFLHILNKSGTPVLGIETWRRRGDQYSIDSLAGWHSEGEERAANHARALVFVAESELEDGDVMTIQYGQF